MASTTICILQLNVEGLTRNKLDLIRHLADENNANIILLQETHVVAEEKLEIEGFNIIDLIPSKHHDIASYSRESINAKPVHKSPENSPVQWSTIEAEGHQITNLYKPATQRSPPSVTCGNFNSRSRNWGYPDTNPDGLAMSSWAEL